MTEVAEKVLNIICKCEVSLYETLYGPKFAVVPISNIHLLLIGINKYKNISRYAVKKALKELVAEGLIYYTSQGCPAIESFDGESYELIDDAHPPINGYALTGAGYKSEMFNQVRAAWNEAIEKLAKGEFDN